MNIKWHHYLTTAMLTLFLMACTPTWYSRTNNVMLAYGPHDLILNLPVADQELQQSATQLVVGTMIANLAAIDGNSDEVSARVLSIPAAELKKIGSFMAATTVSFFYHRHKGRAAVKLTWPKDSACQTLPIARRDLVAILPGQAGLPAMEGGLLDEESLKILIHNLLLHPPTVEKLALLPLTGQQIPNLPTSEAWQYAKSILEKHNIQVVDFEPGINTMQCKLEVQKLDPHSYHRMIYRLKCQVVSSNGELLWQDTGALITLLP